MGSSINSTASSLQSSVVESPEDDALLQYTYHGVPKEPSMSDTLFTRSDSALCMPKIQKRVVIVNKKKVATTVKETSSKEPVNTTEIPFAQSSSLPQQATQSTQDVPIQNLSFNQSGDDTSNSKLDIVHIIGSVFLQRPLYSQQLLGE